MVLHVEKCENKIQFSLVVAIWTVNRWVPCLIPAAGQDSLGLMLESRYILCHKCTSLHCSVVPMSTALFV